MPVSCKLAISLAAQAPISGDCSESSFVRRRSNESPLPEDLWRDDVARCRFGRNGCQREFVVDLSELVDGAGVLERAARDVVVEEIVSVGR